MAPKNFNHNRNRRNRNRNRNLRSILRHTNTNNEAPTKKRVTFAPLLHDETKRHRDRDEWSESLEYRVASAVCYVRFKKKEPNFNPLKCPGHLLLTMKYDEIRRRKRLKVDSRVNVFSHSLRRWFNGTVIEVRNERTGEYLMVQYHDDRTKDVQRWNESHLQLMESEQMELELLDPADVAMPRTPPAHLRVELSNEEIRGRRRLKVDSAVRVFSDSLNEWYDGTVIEVRVERTGEFLNVQYHDGRTKEVQRWNTTHLQLMPPETD